MANIKKYYSVGKWNDEMYKKHPTPYSGIAGLIERYRVSKILNYANIGCDTNVLEIGCEAGNLLSSMPSAKHIVGIDISKNALIEARKKFMNAKNVKLLKFDATKKFKFTKGEFDVIICSETLEHTDKPEMILKNIFNICDNHTRIIITVPIEETKLLIKKILGAIGFMKLFMSKIETEKSEWHIQSYSPSLIKKQTSKYFKIIKSENIFQLHTILMLKRR